MSNLTDGNIHPQVRVFVTMLCEGFNVPSSDTKIQAFADKLKHPHVPALKETYNVFTDGRASTNKMPTIAEVMEVYKGIEKRHTNEEVQKITHENIQEIDHEKSKQMFSQLKEAIIKGGKPITGTIDRPVEDWQDGYKYTMIRDENGKDIVYYHNHPRNEQ
jgi:DNA repair protein RadC|tara:strand:+ start:3245 stop:3727 length:483 start_codon:yes stop_codon:yes gene_type:complete